MEFKKFRSELLYYLLDVCPQSYKKGLFLVGTPRKTLSELYFTMIFRIPKIKINTPNDL